MSKSIHVFCGIDGHIPDLTTAIKSARQVFPKDDVAVGNFYSDKKQKNLKEFCRDQGIVFKEKGQPFFRGSGHRICASEIIGMIQLSKAFYDDGYTEVFLMHADTIIYRDYKSYFRQKMQDNWAAICPLINFLNPRENIAALWERVSSLNSNQIEKSSSARLTQSAVIFNPNFIKIVYDNYTEGSLGDYFSTYWSASSIYGDCALFDLNHFGFKINPILLPISQELSWIAPKTTAENLLEKFTDFTYIHKGASYDPS